jgi:hypothetical protein
MRTLAVTAGVLGMLACTPRDPRSDMSTIEDSTSAGGDFTRAGFDDLDTDDDFAVDEREFSELTELYFSDWDTSQDGRMTCAEMASGLFRSMDRDRDDVLSRVEYAAGVTSWVPNTLDADFDRIDADANGALDRQEVRDGVEELRIFQAYDRDGDGYVSDLEFALAVFQYWDRDRDERVDALEWRLDDNTELL